MYLRVSVTDRCNLRCRYCLPQRPRFATGRLPPDVLRRLMVLITQAAGVRKIRFTGGEPTLCEDLVGHVACASRLVPTVGLTSNGLLLKPLLQDLQTAGLSRLNISLDSLDDQAFTLITRRPGLQQVLASITEAQRLGFSPLRINCVAMQETDVARLVQWAATIGVHLRFIELMRIGEAQAFHGHAYIGSEAIRGRLHAAGIHLVCAPDLDDPTARTWTLPDVDPRHCTVSFITTVTNPFCATCDRIRLDAHGCLRTCLFDVHGVDLAAPLHRGGDAEVMTTVRDAIAAKSPPSTYVQPTSMASIGG